MDTKTDQRNLVAMPATNSVALEEELAWLCDVIDVRLKDYFKKSGEQLPSMDLPEPPVIENAGCGFCQFLKSENFSLAERLILILALTPHIRPQLLDVLWTKNNATERGFTEFGGVLGGSHGGFLPTAETALFLYAGDDLELRFHMMGLLNDKSTLLERSIVQLKTVDPHEPWLSGSLTISREYLDQFTHESGYNPGFTRDFPARCIKTDLNWDYLVLPASVLEQLNEIRNWVLYGEQMLAEWGMKDRLAPGYTSLFYGAPGTGKTLSACLLGKYCDNDVYRVDLSMMVSKYIGETEKNLARVFDAAESRRWILFFDEADALFGKRTKVESSHDRYANQEVSFLLQRIEAFNGVVILASNIKSNIDDSFMRRFQSVIEFPIPKIAERLRLWEQSFSPIVDLEPSINLRKLSSDHELSGGMIINVVRFVSLRALARNSEQILLDDIHEGIRREYLKEGRAI